MRLRSLVAVATLSGAALLQGCAVSSANRAPPAPEYTPVPAALWERLEGVWLGQGGVRIERSTYGSSATLSISQARSALELLVRTNGGTARARLTPLGMLDGTLHFSTSNPEFRGFTPEVTAVLPVAHVDVMLDELDDGVLTLEVFPPFDSTGVRPRPSTIEVGQVSEPGRARARSYGSTEGYLYRDWRHGSQDPAVAFADLAAARSRVGDDITRLREEGWECLSQVRRYVTPNRPTTLELRASPGTPRLHLIHSSTPQVNLAWSASRNPNGYLSVFGRTHNHPAVITERGYTTNLSFRILPAPGALDAMGSSTAVTVFVFGNTFGDYGGGCELEAYGVENRLSSGEYVRAIGTAFLAVAMEGMRRESIESESLLFEILAETARDAAIESSIRQLAPDATEAEVAYYARWTALLASHDLDFVSLFRDSAREYLAEQIRRDAPQFAGSEILLDLLVDVYLQSRQ